MKEEIKSARIVVRVTPGSRRESVSETLGDEGEAIFRIRLTAPAVEGKANKALLQMLRKILGVRNSQLRLTHGEKSRIKLVEVSGIRQQDAESKMRAAVISDQYVACRLILILTSL